MITKSERGEALAISRRLMNVLSNFPIASNEDGANFRTASGRFLMDFYSMVTDQVIGTEMYNCFELARAAGATIFSLNDVRVAMFKEAPIFPLGLVVVNAAIIFSFVEQCQIISNMTFTSRIEVDDLMDGMGVIIEDIKLNKADSFISSDYQNFGFLAALLIQHLSSTERQLPRIVEYQMPINYPSLTLANRIYGDGSRSDELVAENETVHPAFMQRDIVALSV